jgi:hypothetical protein
MRKVIESGLLALIAAGVLAAPAPAVDADEVSRAIEKGIAGLRTMQREDGTWPHGEMGASALAGLALLECGVAADDAAVAKAAGVVRSRGIGCTHTYSIALGILFLDRLGEPEDVALIESLATRLLAGQSHGGWDYGCPPISAEEVRRLTTHVQNRNELVGRRELPKPREGRRTVHDLSPEIQRQLGRLQQEQAAPKKGGLVGDNSNTQFATLALWVARRHGLPVEEALRRTESRFRRTHNDDGGWGYKPRSSARLKDDEKSTPTMTCAGLLGLAVAHGVAVDGSRDADKTEITKDKYLRAGLMALGTTVGNPFGDFKAAIPRLEGRSFYYLWSLERVCVALGLETVGNKDWYGWGAELLLANQRDDGTWRGEFGDSGADTCFALLFLKRSNLARDLSATIRGQVKDPGEATLKAGGVGGEGLTGGSARLPSGIDSKGTADPGAERQRPAADVPAPRLADDLVRATPAEQESLLQQYRDTKGVQYTEALAFAIPRLAAATKDKAREVLAQRLTRLKPESLAGYLRDEEPEIRRAAALACAQKELRGHIPRLIPLLRDRDAAVAKAAHAALKGLSGRDLGTDADAWEAWWKKQGGN